MSDSIDPAEPEVTADPAVETAPFEGEFDADRARRTIDNLRAREKELSVAAKEYERLTTDPSAYTQFGAQQGWVELPEEEEPEYSYTPEPVADPRVDELVAWRDEQNALSVKAAFDRDLDALAAKAELQIDEDDRMSLLVKAVNLSSGNLGPDQTAEVFEAFAARKEQERRAWIDSYTKSKQAPAAPVDGPQGEPRFDLSNMSEAQAREARIARIAALAEEAPAQ
jgi:hypothetical protein